MNTFLEGNSFTAEEFIQCTLNQFDMEQLRDIEERLARCGVKGGEEICLELPRRGQLHVIHRRVTLADNGGRVGDCPLQLL